MFMTREQIKANTPDPPPLPGDMPIERARKAIAEAGYWSDNQQMGNRWPIGCVALEVTQRCNLNCTLCYLSEHSEAVRDVPLEEVFRRIELIHRHYGEHTDVQITGGDPTLRKRDELLAIVHKVSSLAMRPTLMTNGKKASRGLLEDLAAAGLVDVAFHVDTTQGIKGYSNEVELNEVREAYIEHARGLPLSVLFNTTIHRGNFHEIPAIVGFFTANADVVRTASFQLQADTGRGVLRERDSGITLASVAAQIQVGAGTPINFDASVIGHPGCNRYGMCLAVNGVLYDFFDDTAFIGRMQSATTHLQWDRIGQSRAVKTFSTWLMRHPQYLLPSIGWAGRKLWAMKRDLNATGGRINTLSFVIHNFMDACTLDPERIHACVFRVMTADGPVSMCLHNAKRDAYILQPIPVQTAEGGRYWQPLTGELSLGLEPPSSINPEAHKLKYLKGRTRQKVLKDKVTTGAGTGSY